MCSPCLHSWSQQAHISHCNRLLYITVHSPILACHRGRAARRDIELQPWPYDVAAWVRISVAITFQSHPSLRECMPKGFSVHPYSPKSNRCCHIPPKITVAGTSKIQKQSMMPRCVPSKLPLGFCTSVVLRRLQRDPPG